MKPTHALGDGKSEMLSIRCGIYGILALAECVAFSVGKDHVGMRGEARSRLAKTAGAETLLTIGLRRELVVGVGDKV
jgi:hypothetical protein